MSAKDELIALRRMAELEAKANGSSQDMRPVAMPAGYKDSPAWQAQAANNAPEQIDPTEGMSELDKYRSGMGKAFADTGRGLNQAAVEGYTPVANLVDPKNRAPRNQRVQALREEKDAITKQDAPLMNTGAGLAGNITGNVAMVAPTAFIPGANTVTGGALLGGALGALQPVGVEDSRSSNALIGGVAGGVVPGAFKVAGQGFRLSKAMLQPFHDKGQNQIIGNLLRNASGGNADEVAARMMSAKPLVPGSNPTAGQSANNAGIAALERTAEAIDPTAYAANRASQAQARTVALEGLRGNDDAYSAAIQSRNKATAPLYSQVAKSDALADPGRTVNLIDKIVSANPKREALVNALKNVRNTMFDEYPLDKRGADGWKVLNDNLGGKGISGPDFDAIKAARTVLDRVRKGSIDEVTALDQLKGIKASGARASEAIELAKSHIKTPDYVVTQSPQALQSASKNIGDMINAKGPNGSKLNEAIVRELSIIKKSLDNQIGKAEPAYKSAQQTFAAESRPINQMDIARKIAEKAVNPVTGNINPVQFAKALSDKTAAQATGFKRAKIDQIMAPEQMGTLNAIKEDLARNVFRDTAGRSVGSDTVQKLAYSNLIDSAGVPTLLRNSAMGQTAGNVAGRSMDMLYGRANRELANKLAQALLNPQEAGNAMLLSAPKNQALARAIQQSMQAATLPAIPMLTNSP